MKFSAMHVRIPYFMQYNMYLSESSIMYQISLKISVMGANLSQFSEKGTALKGDVEHFNTLPIFNKFCSLTQHI